MAIRLSGAELARMKTDFDAPSTEPPKEEKKTETKKHTGKGNPNGRPPSLAPRRNYIGANLTDAERERLDEAARILNTTKTKVIVEGINLIYLQAKKEERQRPKEEKYRRTERR